MHRGRIFLLLLLTVVSLNSGKAVVGKEAPVVKKPEEKPVEAISWLDARNLTLEGKGWEETESEFDRLPSKAKGIVRPPVWGLSKHSAGMAVRFVSNATSIHARWTLSSEQLAMTHMAATGVSGLDLYVRDKQGEWRWLACGQPKGQTNEVQLVSGITEDERTYLLYLPLYNGVEELEIGVPVGKSLTAAPPRPVELRKPIVFYGTSITQGACASRPGMAHVAMLGRRFDRPVINLGFSGNGRMETEVAEFVAELDAAVFVIDCLPNLFPNEVAVRTKPCVEVIRNAHPVTPILLVEDRTYGDASLVTARREENRGNRQALRRNFEQLKSAGDQNLYYLQGSQLLGEDNEGTVDSSHPNDIGFMRQADAMEQVLGRILSQ